MAAYIYARDSVGDTVDGVKDTFSSWDKCMDKTYCKYVTHVGTLVEID
jgi:hypothetical protein